ncbi:MAG: multicopper oxidase domain-containing protein [Burkholderiales bacterium]|uniref:multicopper oxidase family protein n=1 Tax=Nitrosomonas sp. TaxID=42353 RepID=UPI001D44CE66|nr:multicopper oxidase domain-containing protein [Nitrosomonas sp.]MCB1948914.1 multicopper oxidase domain-containing protein [Nitrosomonas sp.]MCP5243304.1 multicopper oxidase domain-containing protein [Burkholderiales bacterium]
MPYPEISRRKFLQYTALGTLASTMPGLSWAENRIMNQDPDKNFKPDVELELYAQNAEVPILPGAHTHVFQYTGKLLKGPAGTLKTLPGYLGPILNFERGQKIRIFFYNQISEPVITHWHGLHVPQKMDGHPMYEILNGERYVYEFEVDNPAATYWYHSHTHEMTATQVYQGLAGLITVRDAAEQKLELPADEYEIPLVIQDRTFTNGNQLHYLHGRHRRMMGFLGDTILVNGQVNHSIPVKTRAYRLRLLNGSNSRIYKLGWDDGTPLTVIGTDGGLLEKPETFPYVMLAPAERVELWMDFSGRKPGSELTMQSLTYKGGGAHMGGMGRMGGMSGGIPQGKSFSIVKFNITEQVGDSPSLPEKLVSIRRLSTQDLTSPAKTVPIEIGMRHMLFQLNDQTFRMYDHQEIERIPVNSIQKIRIFHEGRMGGDRHGGGMGGRRGMGMMGMMLSLPHPIHLHGQQFQIVSRKQNESNSAYDTIKQGFIDKGWKDTILVMPGEDIEIIKPFEDYTGLFLYHCHNLEHEDLGMMRNFEVY